MKIVHYTILLLILSALSASAQVTVTQLPKTPLEYFIFEKTTPKLLDTYESQKTYFGTTTALEIGRIVQSKYADIDLYSYYTENSDFFSYVETNTDISRTPEYISYQLNIRTEENGAFAVYSRDTFYLTGTVIDSITQTIYDTENSSVDSYAKYDVYYTSSVVTSIELRDDYDSPYTLYNAGFKRVLDGSGRVIRDTTYEYGYLNGGGRGIRVGEWQDHYYNNVNADKIDSTFSYNASYTTQLATKIYYVLNASNEILREKLYTYDSGADTYEFTGLTVYGNEIITTFAKPVAEKLTFSVFPNPAVEKIVVPSGMSFTNWTISTVEGKLMFSGSNSVNQINLAGIDKGVYILRIYDGAQVLTSKFVKQ